jgi:predicted SAM-dependent methyltransferase
MAVSSILAVRLEIGPASTSALRPKWHTLDRVPGCTYQAAWGYEQLPIPSGTYELVLASHVLEHVPWFYTARALREIHRVLKANGTFELWVPDFSRIVNAFVDGSLTDDGWFPLNPERNLWKSLNARLFWGARQGEVGQEQHFHRSCFDESNLTRLLLDAGFADVQRAMRPVGVRVRRFELGLICRKRNGEPSNDASRTPP